MISMQFLKCLQTKGSSSPRISKRYETCQNSYTIVKNFLINVTGNYKCHVSFIVNKKFISVLKSWPKSMPLILGLLCCDSRGESHSSHRLASHRDGFFHPTIFILTHFLIVYVTIDSCILVFELSNVFIIVLTQDYTCSVHEIFACSIFLWALFSLGAYCLHLYMSKCWCISLLAQ